MKPQTLRVRDLIAVLKGMPQNAKVYLASDTEHNNYGTLKVDEKMFSSFWYVEEDNVVIIGPWEEYLQDADVMPKLEAQIAKEYEGKYGHENAL